MNEITEFEEIKDAGVFSWFLDTGNSALFETVIQEFQKGIELLSSVVAIKAHSFDETKDYFEKLCVRGEKLSIEEKEHFLNTRKILDMPPGLNKRSIELIESAQKT